MHQYRQALRSILSTEAKAYGFTLVIWGTGMLTEAQRGRPSRLGVIAFVGGALLAMAVVIIATLGGPMSHWGHRKTRAQHAIGSVHLISVAAAIASGWALTLLVPSRTLAYLVAAGTAVFVYQIVVGLELALSSEVRHEPGSDD